MKKLFFDMKFTQLRQDTTIISLGIIDEDGRSIYAEYTDYNKELVDEWIQDNVIKHTEFLHCDIVDVLAMRVMPRCNNNKTSLFGDRENNRKCILYWLEEYKDQDIQFVSDICHYDMVLLIDALYDNALNMPPNISISCHDINQDIARYLNITDKEATDISREELILEYLKDEPIVKHNALFDAKVIRFIYNKINK